MYLLELVVFYFVNLTSYEGNGTIMHRDRMTSRFWNGKSFLEVRNLYFKAETERAMDIGLFFTNGYTSAAPVII